MPRKATFGTIISGTMQSRDLLPAFIVKFESLSGEAFAEQETVDALLLCEQEDWLNDAGQATLSEITNNLVDSLDAFAPDYGYFGAHPGDGADFGFWLHEDWQQMATDDDVLLIEDLADVPADYEASSMTMATPRSIPGSSLARIAPMMRIGRIRKSGRSSNPKESTNGQDCRRKTSSPCARPNGNSQGAQPSSVHGEERSPRLGRVS